MAQRKPFDDRIDVAGSEAQQAAESDTEGASAAIGEDTYLKYGGTEVSYAGQEYLILSARDVLSAREALADSGHERAHKAQVSAARALVAVRRRTGRSIPDEVLALAKEAAEA
jgi:hypothetical protein